MVPVHGRERGRDVHTWARARAVTSRRAPPVCSSAASQPRPTPWPPAAPRARAAQRNVDGSQRRVCSAMAASAFWRGVGCKPGRRAAAARPPRRPPPPTRALGAAPPAPPPGAEQGQGGALGRLLRTRLSATADDCSYFLSVWSPRRHSPQASCKSLRSLANMAAAVGRQEQNKRKPYYAKLAGCNPEVSSTRTRRWRAAYLASLCEHCLGAGLAFARKREGAAALRWQACPVSRRGRR